MAPRRALLITLDGVGIGAAPDAVSYGDAGADTLGHVAEACGGLELPHLQRMGLGNIAQIRGVPPDQSPLAAWGRMHERSAGKDTTCGHWELAGLVLETPLRTFPQGFPPEIIHAFRRETELDPIGNRAASGTEILRELGEEHLRTGRPIVYTSVDSVFQIAAHEEIIPVERLYEICRIARRILDPYQVGRVIARPFQGASARDFTRTSRRHDFSLSPVGPTLLDALAEARYDVFGVGKIHDIFAGRGMTRFTATQSNGDGMDRTIAALRQIDAGLVFTNLVDFDMLFGHRRDARGFGRALEEFDRLLPGLIEGLGDRDLLVISADHGCDPTTEGTDHTREDVPLLVWSKAMKAGADLGVRATFADVGATLAEFFGVGPTSGGESFLEALGGAG